MTKRVAKILAALAGFLAPMLSVAAFAVENLGVPTEGSFGFQKAYTEQARRIHSFHDNLLVPIIVFICLFVLALLVYVAVRFNEKKNPTPSKLTHHTGLEVAWTVVPVLILVVIAIPSFRLLTYQLTEPKADLTIKVTGQQWQWQYDYPKDQGGGFSFVSSPKADADIKPQEGDIRLLSVDHEAVVPINKTIRLQVTADGAIGVIHSFVVQAFGVRIDAVPGRLNETWFKPERVGMYYGQCSKICGQNHFFMPIAFRVVSQDDYVKWLAKMKQENASLPAARAVVASN